MAHSGTTYTARNGEELPNGWPQCPTCGKMAESVTSSTETADILSWSGVVIGQRFKRRTFTAQCCGADFVFDSSELTAKADRILANMP